ncbi:MAG: response regulator transcription factor [Terriglobales bacterium]
MPGPLLDGNDTIRVLVVEDFPPFLRFISSILSRNSDLEIVGEVSDGLEAIQKMEELKPNLVLLDIGLPRQNGIEVARRIRSLSPESKIIFVSQESSPDVVQEALNLGAWGYVLKMSAAKDLLRAIEAVLEGKQFVSAELRQGFE